MKAYREENETIFTLIETIRKMFLFLSVTNQTINHLIQYT